MNDEMLDALFGRDEEMDDETAKEILTAYGIESADLVAGLLERVEADAAKLIAEHKEIPVPMRNVLKNLGSKMPLPMTFTCAPGFDVTAALKERGEWPGD